MIVKIYQVFCVETATILNPQYCITKHDLVNKVIEKAFKQIICNYLEILT